MERIWSKAICPPWPTAHPGLNDSQFKTLEIEVPSFGVNSIQYVPINFDNVVQIWIFMPGTGAAGALAFGDLSLAMYSLDSQHKHKHAFTPGNNI
jgi:hypothetical protein